MVCTNSYTACETNADCSAHTRCMRNADKRVFTCGGTYDGAPCLDDDHCNPLCVRITSPRCDASCHRIPHTSQLPGNTLGADLLGGDMVTPTASVLFAMLGSGCLLGYIFINRKKKQS
jgi:hypothetical protein